MLDKNKLMKTGLMAMVLIVIISFIVGIFVGSNLSYGETDDLNKLLKENELDTRSYLVEKDLMEAFDNQNCDLLESRITDLGNKLGSIGGQLESENLTRELDENNLYTLKTDYYLLQIKAYTQFKRFADNCEAQFDVVLFYHGKDPNLSIKQGKILDKLVKEQDLRVFAIEYGYSEDLEFMEQFYSINSTPTIILNFEEKLIGLQDYETLKTHLGNWTDKE